MTRGAGFRSDIKKWLSFKLWCNLILLPSHTVDKRHRCKKRESIRRCNEDLRIIERASARQSRRFICSATVRIIMPLTALLPGALQPATTLAQTLLVEVIRPGVYPIFGKHKEINLATRVFRTLSTFIVCLI